MKQKEISVPREWFETLQKYLDRVNSTRDPVGNSQAIDILLGYCSSVETILKIYE